MELIILFFRFEFLNYPIISNYIFYSHYIDHLFIFIIVFFGPATIQHPAQLY